MGEAPILQEFHLPLAQLGQTTADCALCALEYRGGDAAVALAFRGDAPVDWTPAATPAPAAQVPAEVTAPWCATLLSPAATLAQLRQLLDFFVAHNWAVVAIDTLSRRHDCTVLRFQLDAEIDFTRA